MLNPQIINIHQAAAEGDLERIKFFIEEEGIDVDVYGMEEKTPLWLAAENGHLEVVKYLVGKGADIYKAKNEKDNRTSDPNSWQIEITSLEIAIKNGHSAVFKCLHEHTSGYDPGDHTDEFLLEFAVRNSCFEVIDFLLEQGTNIEGDYASTPLQVAIRERLFEVMKYLLDKDEYIDKFLKAEDYNDWLLPFHAAAEMGYLEAVKLILEKGVDIDTLCGDQTSLHCAAKAGQLEVVRYLVENDADIDVLTEYYQTPLHFAAREGYLEVVRYLVENDADIDASDADNATPLSYAARGGCFEVVRYLVENSANISIAADGNNPLYAAIGKKRDDYEDCYSGNEGSLKIVEYLVDNGVVDVNAIVDSGGVTPLHHAVRYRCSRMVKLLLEKGANIEAENEEGKTPLDFAITLKKTLSLISLLSNAGGKINLTNENWAVLNRNLPLNSDPDVLSGFVALETPWQKFLKAEEGCSFLEKTTGLLNILDASINLNPEAAVTIRQTLFRHIKGMIIKIGPSTIAPILSQDIGMLPIILKRDILPVFKKDLVSILKEQDKLEDCNILSKYLEEKDNSKNFLEEGLPNFSDKLVVSLKIVKKLIKGLLALSCESFKKAAEGLIAKKAYGLTFKEADGITLKKDVDGLIFKEDEEGSTFEGAAAILAKVSNIDGPVKNITSFLCKEEQAKLLIACGCVKFSESSMGSNSQTDGGGAVVTKDQDASSARSHHSSSESTILNPNISGEAIRTISDVANVNDEPNSELMGC